MNSLPKTVTRQRRGCDLNPGRGAAIVRPSTPNFLWEGGARGPKLKCSAVEQLMVRKQVGNQNSKSVAIGYFWLIRHTHFRVR